MTKGKLVRPMFAIGAIVIAVIIGWSALAQTKHPLEGTWKANISKSQRDPKHLFESVTLTFQVSEDVVSLTFTGVNMSGEQESGTRKYHADGKEYPIVEAPDLVEVSKWMGSNVMETVAKKDGRVLGQSTYEVSSDGKTLTARIKAIGESGGNFEQVVVFDRQ